ncbi:MAG: aquaporin [Alphaproteobacteria bacterium]|nr:aquaporin [Alphaproteobacteria bacterium]
MLVNKALAEVIGTFTLVFIGCGAAVIAGEHIGFVGISFAFGLGLIAMAYGIGSISGCHINPAVSLGMLVAGRMSVTEFIAYVVSQVIGAVIGAAALYVIVSGQAGDAGVASLGQNGWGEGYIDGYSQQAAIVFELIATFLFVLMILGSTAIGAPASVAGLAIGLALVAIHLVGIPITGTSVNPARSFGPALLVGGQAMAQLWVFILMPLAGGLAAGVVHRVLIAGNDAD